VFELTTAGLALLEVAPGVDLQRDILDRMAFAPIIAAPPAAMDPQLFRPEPIELRHHLLDPDLPSRIHYDAARDTLFLNLRHLQVRSTADIDAIRSAVTAQCGAIGHRVDAVVNYDGFQIAPGLEDGYAAMAHEMQRRHYSSVTRYASGAFKRMKVARALDGDAAERA
jgi:propionate CoA-transferase